MPVSNPSYFPPNRANDTVVGINAGNDFTGLRSFLAGANAGNHSTVNDLIVIGDNSFTAGVTDSNARYSVIIGSNSGTALTDFTDGEIAPIVIIGGNSLPLSTRGGAGTVIVGCYVEQSLPTDVSSNMLGGDTLIGHYIFGNVPSQAGAWGQNTIVGYGACFGNGSGGVGGISCSNNVVIGFEACLSAQYGNWTNNVVIGSEAATSLGSTGANTGGNVVIGYLAGSGNSALTAGNGNVIVGANSSVYGTNQECVVIGNNTQTSGSTNVLIGANQSATSGSNVIRIGPNAGYNDPGNISDQFILEIGGTYGMFYGLFGVSNGGSTGSNLIIGNSQQGTNRDFGGTPGTNLLKLLNGVKSLGANVTNGGYFYVSAGALHWVGSSGTDTTLASA